MSRSIRSVHAGRHALTATALCQTTLAQSAFGQGFETVERTLTSVNTFLLSIALVVVSIAIIWAGFKMIFQGARLSDVANILIGGALIGGAGAIAGLLVS